VMVSATFHLLNEKKDIQQYNKHAFFCLKLVLVLSAVAEFFFLFFMTQWNWFGPSRVI